MRRVRKAQALRLFTCLCFVAIISSSIAASPRNRRFVIELYPHLVNTNRITAKLQPHGGIPQLMSIVILRNEECWDEQFTMSASPELRQARARGEVMPPSRNWVRGPFPDATWMPFQTNVNIDLGPGDGPRLVLFSYRYPAQPQSEPYSGTGVLVRTSPIVIEITSPSSFVTSQPCIQLQGSADRDLRLVAYDRYNSAGEKVVSAEKGHAGSTYNGDMKPMLERKGFTCYDVKLDPGTNTIVLSCRDDAGNYFATNLSIVFTTEGDLTPPALRLDWPRPGMRIMGPRFTARGLSDDPTAKLHGQIACAGQTNYFEGIVELNGYFWFEHIPLAPGTNGVSLTASDAAGNMFTTNFVICGVDSPAFAIDPVDAKLLFRQFIPVTGKVDLPCRELWINGVQARVSPDGSWEAMEVPVNSPNWGGTAIFSVTAIKSDPGIGNIAQTRILSAQAALGNSEMVLNATNPACGVFRLHLTGTAGRAFVLEASTNLVHWIPVLTNLNPSLSFDFTDSDFSNYPCRFFKVVPLQ